MLSDWSMRGKWMNRGNVLLFFCSCWYVVMSWRKQNYIHQRMAEPPSSKDRNEKETSFRTK